MRAGIPQVCTCRARPALGLESDFFSTLGQSWAIKNYDGAMFSETYGTRTFAVTCPDCDEWRKWAADTAGWIVKAFGARGIYLDQLGSAEPFPCYEPGHAHSGRSSVHHGQYNHGYLKMIREVRDRIRALDPSSFLMIEDCGDIYSQHLYANLTWNGAFYDESFNMYRYTFPEFIQVNMVNTRRIADRAERAAWFYEDIARAFVLGSVFWAEQGDMFCEEDGCLLDLFRAALRLRKQAAPYIAHGVYHDEMGIASAASHAQDTRIGVVFLRDTSQRGRGACLRIRASTTTCTGLSRTGRPGLIRFRNLRGRRALPPAPSPTTSIPKPQVTTPFRVSPRICLAFWPC